MKKVVILFVLALSLIWAVSASAEEQTYTVQPGDRLERVAAEHGLTGDELLAANPRSSYGIACGDPRRVELRDGSKRAICGRPRIYLIAGKTLVIPVSSLVLEMESAQLSDQVAALQTEAEKLRQEFEASKTAIADLQHERDNLRDENKNLVAAKAELQGKYSESQSDFVVVSSRQPKEVEVRKTNYVHVVLASAITAFLAALVIFFVLYRKGEKEKKFDHLVLLVQPSILAQAEKNKQRGAELDKQAREIEAQKSQSNDLQTKLAKQKGEQDRRDGELKSRDETLKQEGHDLAMAKLAVEGREATCTRREEEIHGAENGLRERSEAFSKHVQTENERLREANEAIARGKEELAAAGRTLDAKKAEVDASLRTAAEDLPGMQRDREQIVEYAQDIVVREDDVSHREEEVSRREQAVAAQIEETDRRKDVVEDAERVLAGRKRDAEAHEAALEKSRDELARRERELAEQLAEAQHTLDVAGGLEKAQNILKRAGRKAEIVEALDAREKILNDWEDRLVEREGLPRVRGPHRPTLSPPPLPLPGDISSGASADDDDKSPTVTFQPPTDEEIDPRAATHIEIAPGPATPIDSVDIVGGTSPDSSPPEESQPAATPAAADSSVRETGPQIPIADRPSGEESGIYCKVCKAVFSPDVYAVEHAEHDQGLASGDLDKK